MKRTVFIGTLLFMALAGGASRAEFKINKTGVNYMNRQSTVLDNHYLQYFVDVHFNKYLNPCAGMEHDQTEGQLRRYFVGNTFQFTDIHAAVLRYNRTEYPDWDIFENIVNIYYKSTRKYFRGAAGVSYHSVDLFGDTMNQIRLNFELSVGREFFDERAGMWVGINNFNEFENFATMLAFNEAGPFIDVHSQVREDIYLTFYYEPRMVGLGGGHPYLARETWYMGLSWTDWP